jgi:hypothetical protein
MRPPLSRKGDAVHATDASLPKVGFYPYIYLWRRKEKSKNAGTNVRLTLIPTVCLAPEAGCAEFSPWTQLNGCPDADKQWQPNVKRLSMQVDGGAGKPQSASSPTMSYYMKGHNSAFLQPDCYQ